MELSIIVPVLNDKERVKEFLEQMKKQTMQPEIVLVDGGSTDGTVELIKKYQKELPNLKLYFETGPYRSVANAMNIGMEKAKGEFAFLCGIDTVFEERFSEKIIKEVKKNRGVDLLKFFWEPQKVEFKSSIEKSYYYRDISRITKPYLMILRKEKLPKFDPSLGYGEDKIWTRQFWEIINDIIKKGNYVDTNKKIRMSILGPKNLSEVWKRHKWYGRTGMLYYKKSHDKIHLLKMILAIISIPFIPVVIAPMIRGFIYATRIVKKYPQGLIMIPVLEALAFPAMAVGFWEYLAGKSKKHRGH